MLAHQCIDISLKLCIPYDGFGFKAKANEIRRRMNISFTMIFYSKISLIYTKITRTEWIKNELNGFKCNKIKNKPPFLVGEKKLNSKKQGYLYTVPNLGFVQGFTERAKNNLSNILFIRKNLRMFRITKSMSGIFFFFSNFLFFRFFEKVLKRVKNRAKMNY